MTVDQKVKALRALMKKTGVDCWYINGTDPHQSEYVCPRWRTRAWISGFTGSAGTVVITRKEALLWVDSRYFIQGAQQIEGSCFRLMKLDTENTPSPMEWVRANLHKGQSVGIDHATLSLKTRGEMLDTFGPKGIVLMPMDDLLDAIWTDRPAVPDSKVIQLSKEITGYSRSEKFAQVREKMEELGCGFTLISALDDIAWVTNLRGDDIAYNPVFLSYLLLGKEKAWLFTDPARFSADLLAEVTKDMEVLPYENAASTIKHLVHARDVVYLNPERTNMLMAGAIGKAKVIFGRDFTTDMKARKNDVEMEGMRKSHLLDGVALVNFLASLDRQHPNYDEYQLTEMLRAQRLRAKDCLGESFGPIAGFSENGAMCHYSATKETHKTITGSGLVVLDTGGMYTFGMTDVTRTILFGTATPEEIRDYTVVLKGHLALAAAKFPKGTCGYQLDILAKQFMWQYGMTFYHGTGHGVGFRLNVHEGPQNISHRPVQVPMEVGMVTSDEPGIYKEGRHGIRIENLIACQAGETTEFGPFYQFETLTLCPYERALIDVSMLTDAEIRQINAYHARVYASLKDLVDLQSLAYLKDATKPIEKGEANNG
ncbi:MAG: aminopeptidase P family protein [Sphaerochaetaceae bacterium]